MKNNYSQLALAAACLLVSQMSLADPGVSRAQVVNELLEAQRSGDVIASESGQRLNEMSPGHYPPKAKEPGIPRAQVEAELAEALRTGNMIASDSGQKQNEINPSRYR